VADSFQGFGGKVSYGCGMIREQRLQFLKECGHLGIVHGSSFLTQFSDPIFDEVDFHDYQR
jgi:hypothetical protein